MQENSGSVDANNEKPLEQRLKQVIAQQDLASLREQVQRLTNQLDVDILSCAAALLSLHQPQLIAVSKPVAPTLPEPVRVNYRFVRYRLDIGSQHKVDKEQIKAVLIEESGVDKKRIGRIDIRQNYTLVEMPDGMPADIFQLLSEASIGDRKLAIKRVKQNRRGPRSY